LALKKDESLAPVSIVGSVIALPHFFLRALQSIEHLCISWWPELQALEKRSIIGDYRTCEVMWMMRESVSRNFGSLHQARPVYLESLSQSRV